MKLLVEFELDESWEAYIPDNEQKLKMLLRHDLEGVKAKVIDLDLLCKKCSKEPQITDELCNKCYYDEHKQN